MNLIDICEIKYPGQISQGNIQFRQEWATSPIEISLWEVPGIEQPLESDLLAEIADYETQYLREKAFNEYKAYVEGLLEETAKSKNYGSCVSLATYATSTNPQWALEAQTFVAWRDALYSYSLNIQQQVIDELIPIPTFIEFIEGMPAITWP